jgi:ribose 5-phosphate isomerase A
MTAEAPPPGLAAAAARALELVEPGTTLGLGSGRAASAFIEALGVAFRGGLMVRGVPSSEASAAIARRYGIPLVTIDEGTELALTVDGADEIAPNLDVVKGRGGALVRERIIAAASRRQVIVAGPEKRVQHLGERGPVPVELVPLAEGLVLRRLKALGVRPALRRDARAGAPIVSENGNLTFDCSLELPLADGAAARALEAAIRAIPGVVDTGLFLGTAERILIGHADGRVEVMTRGGS